MSKSSLEDLIALNDEISSLVRAGVPLELGLSGTSSTINQRLRGLTRRLSDQMIGGKSLMEALDAEEDSIPNVYRAVVETGLKTGRLPEALEAMTEFSQSFLELQRRISLALLYPAIVLTTAYVLFLSFLHFMVPQLNSVYRDLRIPAGYWIELLNSLSNTMPIWGGVFPVVLILVILGRNASGQSTPSGSRIGRVIEACGRFPGMRVVLANSNRATFAHLFALLIEHQIPLHDAIQLAAESTGDRRIVSESRKIAAAVRDGRSLVDFFQTGSPFSPLMEWMLGNAEKQSTLGITLRQISDIYRRRALFQSDWLKTLLPVAFVLLIGGGATLIYGLTLFLPLAQMLRALSID